MLFLFWGSVCTEVLDSWKFSCRFATRNYFKDFLKQGEKIGFPLKQ